MSWSKKRLYLSCAVKQKTLFTFKVCLVHLKVAFPSLKDHIQFNLDFIKEFISFFFVNWSLIL